MNDGLTASESDPRFHQQMVYAVAMKTLENFEKALGRRLRDEPGRHELRIRPNLHNQSVRRNPSEAASRPAGG